MSLHPDIERVARLGWRLHPASRFSRAACIKNAADLASSDRDQLERWSREFPGCGWRVVMEGSGIWALDVDVPSPDHAADGVKALAELVAVHGSIPHRPTTRSGGGGLALFFRHDGEPITGKTGTPAPGLDPRRGRLSVAIPPSIHPRSGVAYRWITAPWELPPPPAPPWLLRLVAPPPEPPLPATKPRLEPGSDSARRYAMAALRNASERVCASAAGTRNSRLNSEVFSLGKFIRAGSLEAREVAEAMAYAARQAGLDRIETQQTITSALAAGARQ